MYNVKALKRNVAMYVGEKQSNNKQINKYILNVEIIAAQCRGKLRAYKISKHGQKMHFYTVSRHDLQNLNI